MRSLLVSSVIVLAAGAAMSCSGDDDGHGPSHGPHAAGCAAEPRKDEFAAGLSKPAGSLSVTLIESRPPLPIKGENAMTLEIRDAAGQPLDAATVTVTPWMPDHAHGSADKPIVTPKGSGRYDVEQVYLVMAGLWQIKIAVQPQGSATSEETMFLLCLDG